MLKSIIIGSQPFKSSALIENSAIIVCTKGEFLNRTKLKYSYLSKQINIDGESTRELAAAWMAAGAE